LKFLKQLTRARFFCQTILSSYLAEGEVLIEIYPEALYSVITSPLTAKMGCVINSELSKDGKHKNWLLCPTWQYPSCLYHFNISVWFLFRKRGLPTSLRDQLNLTWVIMKETVLHIPEKVPDRQYPPGLIYHWFAYLYL